MRVWARGGRRRPFSEFTYIHIAIPPLAHVCSPPQPWDPEWGTGPLRSQVSLRPGGGGRIIFRYRSASRARAAEKRCRRTAWRVDRRITLREGRALALSAFSGDGVVAKRRMHRHASAGLGRCDLAAFQVDVKAQPCVGHECRILRECVFASLCDASGSWLVSRMCGGAALEYHNLNHLAEDLWGRKVALRSASAPRRKLGFHCSPVCARTSGGDFRESFLGQHTLCWQGP